MQNNLINWLLWRESHFRQLVFVLALHKTAGSLLIFMAVNWLINGRSFCFTIKLCVKHFHHYDNNKSTDFMKEKYIFASVFDSYPIPQYMMEIITCNKKEKKKLVKDCCKTLINGCEFDTLSKFQWEKGAKLLSLTVHLILFRQTQNFTCCYRWKFILLISIQWLDY